ncbi:hypothetical protein FXW26_03430 [Candidatus Liberibacter asiaticus]|nr:hypothetical protein FXW26_03430 [Candidatus Liberibacter asiaticus]KAE9516361.1 hypothetical protein FXW27_03455 [Candidatus Liberibacter asiaticus]
MNNRTNIPKAIRIIKLSNSGAIYLTPSTAERTDSAGVTILSPINNAEPAKPNAINTVDRLGIFFNNKARRDNIPPSPSLSALNNNKIYFIVTTMVRTQIMRETKPITSVLSTRRV